MARSDVVVDRRPPPRASRSAAASGGVLLFPILLLSAVTLVNACLAFASTTSASSRVVGPFHRRHLIGPDVGVGPKNAGRAASASSPSSSLGEDPPWVERDVNSVHRRKDGKRSSSPFALASTRGGGGENNDEIVDGGGRRLRVALEKTALVVAAVVGSYLLYDNRSLILELFDREKFKSDLLVKLRNVETMGLRGLIMYSSAFALWEFVGAPTVPVETMAGMAFGIKRGFLASGIGKLTGAFAAYSLGRDWLNDVVRSKFDDSEVMRLVDRSSERKPFRVALTMKYSSFPELTKNFGLGILPSVRPWMFLLATCLHGLPFTMLWTCLGHDSAKRLKLAERGIPAPPSKVLHGLTVGVAVFGCVFSPILVGIWINEMRKEHVAAADKGGKGRANAGGKEKPT